MLAGTASPLVVVSTHSRPKAAGYQKQKVAVIIWSFNTQPPEGGWEAREAKIAAQFMFQHTAARRRLA